MELNEAHNELLHFVRWLRSAQRLEEALAAVADLPAKKAALEHQITALSAELAAMEKRVAQEKKGAAELSETLKDASVNEERAHKEKVAALEADYAKRLGEVRVKYKEVNEQLEAKAAGMREEIQRLETVTREWDTKLQQTQAEFNALKQKLGA